MMSEMIITEITEIMEIIGRTIAVDIERIGRTIIDIMIGEGSIETSEMILIEIEIMLETSITNAKCLPDIKDNLLTIITTPEIITMIITIDIKTNSITISTGKTITLVIILLHTIDNKVIIISVWRRTLV